MADYIIIDRGNPESRDLLYEKARNFLKRGVSVMMFPEGTRSGDMEIHFFKRGAFKLAIENNIPILPIVIYGTGGILHKGGLSLGREHKIVIKVLDPVSPENFGTTDYDNLATRFQLMITETYKEIKGE